MYYPIPGFSHLKLYRPPDPVRYERSPSPAELSARTAVAALVRIAVEVAAGLRPPSQLKPRSFDPSIPLHLGVWTKIRGTAAAPASCGLTSLHARADGEFFGTARIGERQHAFIGRCAPRKLLAFRLL